MVNRWAEVGHCDPTLYNKADEFITCNTGIDGRCRVGACRTIPNNIPIKQLLKGTMAVPWVRLRFESTTECPPDCVISPGAKTDCKRLLNQEQTESSRQAIASYWDYTEITTGNISQPGCIGNTKSPNCKEKCRAVIKSFQYAWGSTQAGSTCKVMIHDEAGSTLDSWFWRIIKNPIAVGKQSVYKMKVTFGWLIVGGDNDCPAEVTGSAQCQSTPSYSNNRQQLICSPPIYFLPTNLTSSMQNGKFIYELEGKDLLQQAQTRPGTQSDFGGNNHNRQQQSPADRTHFVDAVVKLGMTAEPPFRVQFAQLNENSGEDIAEQLQFFRLPATGSATFSDTATVLDGFKHEHLVIPGGQTDLQFGKLNWYKLCNDESCVVPANTEEIIDNHNSGDVADGLKYRGPLKVYHMGTSDPIGAINSWLTEIRADSRVSNGLAGKGITINYDSTYQASAEEMNANPNLPATGRLILWADPASGSINGNNAFFDRKKALYIVNGGKFSSVFNFTPNVKYYWNAIGAGGISGPASGTNTPITRGLLAGDLTSSLDWWRQTYGAAPIIGGLTQPSDSSLENGAAQAQTNLAQGLQANALTNGLHNVIEGELKVQGDPSDWLCTPFLGIGRTVAIVVINPFFLSNDPEDMGSNGCPQWVQKQRTPGCARGCGVNSRVCHDVLTNINWFIESVEHVIKEGSYVTNIKVKLLMPGINIPAVDPQGNPIGLGGDENAVCSQLCEQGHETDPTINQLGSGDDSIPVSDENSFTDDSIMDMPIDPCINLLGGDDATV